MRAFDNCLVCGASTVNTRSARRGSDALVCGGDCYKQASRNFKRNMSGYKVARLVDLLAQMGEPVTAAQLLARYRDTYGKSAMVGFNNTNAVTQQLMPIVNPETIRVDKTKNPFTFEYLGGTTIGEWLKPSMRAKYDSVSFRSEQVFQSDYERVTLRAALEDGLRKLAKKGYVVAAPPYGNKSRSFYIALSEIMMQELAKLETGTTGPTVSGTGVVQSPLDVVAALARGDSMPKTPTSEPSVMGIAEMVSSFTKQATMVDEKAGKDYELLDVRQYGVKRLAWPIARAMGIYCRASDKYYSLHSTPQKNINCSMIVNMLVEDVAPEIAGMTDSEKEGFYQEFGDAIRKSVFANTKDAGLELMKERESQEEWAIRKFGDRTTSERVSTSQKIKDKAQTAAKKLNPFAAEEETDFKGHNVCVECGSDEIPLSSTDGGEQGLMDYYFNCSDCNFGWFVAVRDETNADEPNTVGVSYEGFMDFDSEEEEEEEEYYIRYRPKFAGGYLLEGPFSNLEKAQDEARLMSLFKEKHRGVLGIQEGKTYPPNYVLTKSFCKMCGADSENPCVCMIGPEVKPCTNKMIKKWKSDAIAHFPCPCSIKMEKTRMEAEDEEEEEEEELKQYSVTVPVLHYYSFEPVEAYDEDEAVDEVRNNWGHWRRTIENNGDWGGPLWRYSRLSSHDPEAYEILDSETFGSESQQVSKSLFLNPRLRKVSVGDRVRSYDFVLPDGTLIRDDCYMEGRVTKIAPVEWCGSECDHYYILVDRVVRNGEEIDSKTFTNGQMVFPPVSESYLEIINETFDVEFNDWADQEMMTHGKDVSFKEWAEEEGEKHGDMDLTDWAKEEEESHDERYESESREEYKGPFSVEIRRPNGSIVSWKKYDDYRQLIDALEEIVSNRYTPYAIDVFATQVSYISGFTAMGPVNDYRKFHLATWKYGNWESGPWAEYLPTGSE